jgi:hypothetical protein
MYLACSTEYFKTHGKFLQFIRSQLIERKFIPDDGLLVENIAAHCPNVRKLQTSLCLSSEGFTRIVQCCRQLEDVTCLEGLSLTRGLISALHNAPCLERLKLEVKRGGEVVPIASPCLKYLAIRSGDSSTDAFGVALAESCPSLQELHIGFCRVTDATLVALAAHCKKLHTIDVNSRSITQAGLVALTGGCSLRNFTLECDHTITWRDLNIRTIARNCPQLENLRLYSPGERSNTWLTAIAEHCPNVDLLQLHGLMLNTSASGLLAVAQKCRHLRNLYIVCNERDPGSSFCSAFGHVAKLEHFDLNSPISDALINALSRCAHLQIVTLSDVRYDDLTVVHSISNDCILALAQGCPALKTLWLPELLEVNMDVVRALSCGCPSLTFLSTNLRGMLGRHKTEIALLLPKCQMEDISKQLDFEPPTGNYY